MQNKPGAFALTWDAWWDDHYQIDLEFSRSDLKALHQFPFLSTARDAQRPPKGNWRTWLFMGGRGAGKTRAGAEWVRFAALHGQCQRVALIGPTLGDALWRRSDIDGARIYALPDRFEDIIVAVDPPTTSHARSDSCGIIAAGKIETPGFPNRCIILADGTEQGLSPTDWAGRAVSIAYSVGASRIVAEANQGGEMVESVLRSVGCDLPIQRVTARLGKRARALPVAALYSQGHVSHLGVLAALEDEMCRFGTDGMVGSPDRVDALVWAVSVLMLSPIGTPRIRAL